MKRRWQRLFVAAALSAGLLACLRPAQAQEEPAKPPAKAGRPAPRGSVQNLDLLFQALKIAPDNTSAKAISDRIWDVWLSSGGDTATLLMTRVRASIESKDYDLALQVLDGVIAFKPDYAEAWNQRATVYYLKKDYGRAMADLAQALAREPRHFGALFGLGIILQEFGEERRALEVYRRVLALDPHMQRVPDMVKTLSQKLEGRDI
ncbi:MAG TPA: tetratricopeptide repeat protein [Xanthobacteraceae bacterium]|nr:tetratricopeptide repeat protein [Xanthobacteraceae bacterium]